MELSIYDKIGLISENKNLNNFINDPNEYVRKALALKGYALDVLINDTNYIVRKTVIKYCKEHPEEQKCKDILLLNSI